MKKILVAIVLVSFMFVVVGCKGGGTTTSKTSNLTIKVVDTENKALSSVSLDLNGTKGTTDSSGSYVFKNLNAGSYTVEAILEGYESNSGSVEITEGKDASLTITLSKKETVEELQEFSNLKSYEFTFVMKQKNGKTETIKSEINDYGKREHMIITNEEGEVETEYYLVNDKAKMRSGSEEWLEFTGEQAESMSGMFSSLAQSFVDSAQGWYNTSIKTPQADVSFVKLGTETVNGYSTTKYQYTVKGSALGTTDYDKVTVTYWVINKGDYKNYTTRLYFEYFPKASAENNVYTNIEFNFTRIGENIDIKLP